MQSSSDPDCYTQAQQIQSQIYAVMAHPPQHFGIHRLQDLFTRNAQRLYHWAKHCSDPADKNRAHPSLRVKSASFLNPMPELKFVSP